MARRWDQIARPVASGPPFAEIEERRWGPEGREHFGDPRPGDYPGRRRTPREPPRLAGTGRDGVRPGQSAGAAGEGGRDGGPGPHPGRQSGRSGHARRRCRPGRLSRRPAVTPGRRRSCRSGRSTGSSAATSSRMARRPAGRQPRAERRHRACADRPGAVRLRRQRPGEPFACPATGRKSWPCSAAARPHCEPSCPVSTSPAQAKPPLSRRSPTPCSWSRALRRNRRVPAVHARASTPARSGSTSATSRPRRPYHPRRLDGQDAARCCSSAPR